MYWTNKINQVPFLWRTDEVQNTANSARIFKQSMGARNREGIGLSYRPARLHSLTELIPGNRF
jgi:hypothetical protein